MKLYLTILAALVPVFLAIGPVAGAQPGELQAVYNLSGVLQSLENKELTVTFSDDMLPLGGQRDGASLVRITPFIKGEFFWRGNRTLAFKPESRFRYSTTYTAVIPVAAKSLAGKTLAREMRWQWSTPLAYPVEIRTSSQEYFSHLNPKQKLDRQVWVNDSLILRFNQPVDAVGAGNFFVLREAKSGARGALALVQKDERTIAAGYAQDLKRGTLYEFTIRKGFHGSEGETGTAEDFTFHFETVPPFQYAGPRPLVLFPDSPRCWLPFSNPLADENHDGHVRVFKIAGEKKTPLKFRLEQRHYENEALFLTVGEELASGEALRIVLDGNLANVYRERLGQDLELEAKVCSSRSPRIGFSIQDKKLSMVAKSIKQADVRMLKLKPGFHALLANRGHGIMQSRGFPGKFVEKEVLRAFSGLPEKINYPALSENELGSPLGFFAFLVQRREPYNICQEASLMRLPAYAPPALEVFHRRDMDMVIKASPKQTFFWLYDNRTGKGLGGRTFFLERPGREALALGESSAAGVLAVPRSIAPSDLILAKDPGTGDMALASLDHEPTSARELRIAVFSDRDFYKPGDTVHIAGIVKNHDAGKISSPQAATALLEIMGPDWQKVKSEKVPLDALGGFHFPFQSDPVGKKGLYHLRVTVQDSQSWQGQHAVTIDYYQPNTFAMKISGIAERYLFSNTFRARISGAYLAGNPMAGDAFSHALALAPAAIRIFHSRELERYAFGLERDLMQNDPQDQGGGKLDANGGTALEIPLNKFQTTNYVAGIDFSTTGKSAEGKEFTARASSLYFPGNLLTGIRVDFYQNSREQVKADLALVDFQGKPVAGEIRVTLYRENYEKQLQKLDTISGPEDIFIEKTKTHVFRVPKPGHYVLRCDTPDGNGRVVSTSARFFAWDNGFSGRSDGLQIESEQKVLHGGKTLKGFIRSPRAGQALVTVERDGVLDSQVIALQRMTPFEIPVKKEYFPAIRVGVVVMYEDNVSEETHRDFTVRDEGKTLQVGLDCTAEIKPATKAQVRIQVRDQRGKGAKAKLIVYAVDEGNLSLQGYRTPDPLQRFYYDSPLGRSALRTYYSKRFNHWTFTHPMLDIDLPSGPAIFGRVCKPDATPLAGATVTLEDQHFKKLQTMTASSQGYYVFTGIPAGRYALKAEATGFHSILRSDLYFNGNGHEAFNLALIPIGSKKNLDPAEDSGMDKSGSGGALGGVEDGVMPAPSMAEAKGMARMKEGGQAQSTVADLDVTGIHVRRDFKEVLFFKTVETNEAGNTAVDFESSDQLSTYRIMAVAYSEDGFGSSEKDLLVSKDLLISEAMPEFARQGDEFSAGAQLSNRTAGKLPFTLLVKPQGLSLRGDAQIHDSLSPRANALFRFPFTAEHAGEAKIEFYAVSAADKDGLEKNLLVTDRRVRETLLDFTSGKTVTKQFTPQAGGEEQAIAIKVASSLLRPAVSIAKKLIFYPYECLEQRASKVMPFLALSPQLAERLDLGLDQSQVRAAVNGFLKVIPEFMNSAGALSYYRGGQYTSDYLTAYVLWSLYLARERDYEVDPQLVQKLSAYLQRASLDQTCQSFHQFVLSLHKNADNKKLKKLAAARDGLPLPARVFLYRALHHQGIEATTRKAMLDEFNSSLQVEADFAYFDAGDFAYHRDFPFYSSRFATALLLQAVLEVEKEHVLAERIIHWLLEAEPHCWNTTQTNFWVLCAMDEYLKRVEKTTARGAEINLLGERATKTFSNSRDTLVLSKKLETGQGAVEAAVKADQPVYVTSELTWKLARAGKKSRGIEIQRNVYNEKGEAVSHFQRGQVYMVELLVRTDKEVPYGIVDEPLAAGFELLRQDIASTRSLKEFNVKHNTIYRTPWARQENAADRLVFYTYSMQGPLRLVYFIKAMYAGRFTWMPTIAQGVYHPQYFGRNDMQTIEVSE